jgi:hypothetical protein
MPECFVATVSEMQDGDRRIVVASNNEIGVFNVGGAYLCLRQLLRSRRGAGLRGPC